jgi:transcription elongation factor GreB
MSKAFTKESDGDDDDGSEGESASPLPAGTKNYISLNGFERLRSELKTLLNETRPELVRTVSWAASNGDRSENGDYLYGKRRLREVDRRIRFLSKRIDLAEVVDPDQQPNKDKVLFGATVQVEREDGRKVTYQIVGIDETDAKQGRVSWISPMAKALLHSKVGDFVSVKTPAGEEDLEVLHIAYKAID